MVRLALKVSIILNTANYFVLSKHHLSRHRCGDLLLALSSRSFTSSFSRLRFSQFSYSSFCRRSPSIVESRNPDGSARYRLSRDCRNFVCPGAGEIRSHRYLKALPLSSLLFIQAEIRKYPNMTMMPIRTTFSQDEFAR
jgi:hypothetical protein